MKKNSLVLNEETAKQISKQTQLDPEEAQGKINIESLKVVSAQSVDEQTQPVENFNDEQSPKTENRDSGQVERTVDGQAARLFGEKYVQKLRKESSRYRVALKEMQEVYAEFPVDKLAEYKGYAARVEELSEELAEMERKESARLVKEGTRALDKLLTRFAKLHGAIAPKQVATLLRGEVAVVEGEVFAPTEERAAEVESRVVEYLSENPHLVKSRSRHKGANSAPHIKSALSVEQVSSMTPKQYASNRDRILKSLTNF